MRITFFTFLIKTQSILSVLSKLFDSIKLSFLV